MQSARDRARFLDELGARATPATVNEPHQGWLFRASPDVLGFRRPNTVLTLGHVSDVEAAIDAGERFCRSHGFAPVFMVSDGSSPADLDARLAAGGYDIEAPVDILVTQLGAVDARPGPKTSVVTGVDDAWIDEYAARFGDESVPAQRIAGYAQMLRRVEGEVITATVSLNGAVAAVGFGVVEQGWLGVFGMGTAVEARRTGCATSILAALSEAAREIGAADSYLQVECDNDVAQRVYRAVGYERSHGYHYRRLGSDATHPL